MGTRHTFAIAALAVSLALGAQTLDQANNAPVPGQTFTFHQTNNVPPGPGGANQIWDFSNMPSGAAVNLNYLPPNATPYNAVYPSATVAGIDWLNDITYLQAGANGIDFLGKYSAVINSVIIYQDVERVMTYPCGYNTSWTDNFSSAFSSSGTPVSRTGTISGLADGYGTLIMPNGTYPNVLRVRTIEDYTDVVAGGAIIIDYLFTHYSYYLPGTPVPLISVHDQLTVTNGSPSSVLFARWLTSSPTGMDQVAHASLGVEVYPNPATDQIAVVFGSAGGAHLLEILDGLGRTVLVTRQPTLPVGIERLMVDVGALPSGLYQLRITNDSGKIGVRRFLRGS